MKPGRPVQDAGTAGYRGRQGGIALVIVLWVTVLLGVIAASTTLSIRTETVLTRNWVESAQARANAEAGVRIALLELLGTNAGSSAGWRADGTVHQTTFNGSTLRIAIYDEGGRIDLNAAPGGLIDGLLRSVGVEDEERKRLVDAILDWRDEDQLRRDYGAEGNDYAAAGLPYSPGDKHFSSVEELALVLGMTPALYRRLAGALTVYSGEAGINPAVAPRQVLLAVPGIDAAEVERYLQLRQEHAGDVPPPFGLPGRYVSMRRTSGIFSVQVEAKTAGGATERLAAVVKPTALAGKGGGRPYVILARKEAADLLF